MDTVADRTLCPYPTIVASQLASARNFPSRRISIPDTLLDGVSTLERIVREGVYRSQFETVTSNER